MKKIFSLFAAVLFAFAANAATINITNETPDALRLALNGASDGDEIVMAAGTYVESNSNYIAFDGKAVTVKAAEGANVIIQPQVPITVSNGGHAIFENVKIDASRLQELSTDYEHLLYVTDGNPNGCTFRGCELYGFNLNKSMFYCNNANKVALMKFENCYLHDIMKSIIFIENTEDKPMVSVKNCTFENISTNTESYWAGVIDVRAAEATLQVDHCTFYNVIPMNTDYSCVSKITLAKGTVSNCIFMLPTAQDGIRAMRGVTATNCITFNYLKDSGTGIHSSVTQTNCLQVDPAFVDPDNGNFTLGEGSPALTMNDGQPIGDPRWWPKAISAVPTEAAPVPTWPADQVVSLYSDTYTFAPSSLNSYNEGWWDQPTLTEEAIDGNKFLHYNGRMTGMIGWQFGDISASVMEFIHVDIWPSANTTLNMGPTSPNNVDNSGNYVASVSIDVEAGKWNSIDIPVADLAAANASFTLADVFQNQFTGYSALTDLSVDNVFFYRTTPYVDETAPADVTAALDAASFFGATIKASATDESGAVSFTVKDGETIVGTGAAASGAETIINVAGLKPGTKYDLSVIAADANGNAADPVTVEVTTLEAPAADAAPAFAAEDVKSLFSDAYEPAVTPIDYMQVWWKGAPIARGELAEGDNVIFYGAADADASFGWAFELQDLTDYPYLHMSIYPLAAGTIEIYPVQKESNEAPYHRITETLVANQWNNLDFDFSELELTKIQQIGWCNYASVQGFFVDNVFFSKDKEVTTAIDNTAAAVKAQKVIMNGQLFIIRDGQMFNAQGQLQ